MSKRTSSELHKDGDGSSSAAIKQPRLPLVLPVAVPSAAATETNPASAAPAAKHSAKAAATAAPKHPPLLAAAIAALRQLRAAHGSSLKAITRQMTDAHGFDAAKSGKHLARAIKAAVASGVLIQVCAVGRD